MSDSSRTVRGTTWGRHAYKILTVAAFSLMAFGTIVYHFVEDWSWVDALYFATVAVTTVGFGDLVPTTDGSKLFTVLYVLVGMTIITTYLHTRFEHVKTNRASSTD